MIYCEVLSLLIHNCSLVTTKNLSSLWSEEWYQNNVDLEKFWPDLKSLVFG